MDYQALMYGKKVGLGATTFNADQVIGKSLTAKKSIALKSNALDSSPAIASVSTGQPVGIVYSYLNPGVGRNSLYWDVVNNGKHYFVKHETGAFDIADLQTQGALTSEQLLAQKKDEEAKANDPITYYFKKLAVPTIITVGIIYGVVQLGKTYIGKKVK